MQKKVFSRELGLAYGVTNGRLQAKESHLLFQILVGVLSLIFVFNFDLPQLHICGSSWFLKNTTHCRNWINSDQSSRDHGESLALIEAFVELLDTELETPSVKKKDSVFFTNNES